MALQHLEASPKSEDYTPLQEHQEQTPSTFFGAKPVLYAQYSGLTLSSQAAQLQQDAAVAKFTAEQDGEESLIKNVDIWVSSENLILFQESPSPTGISIPYRSIALHATMKYKFTIEALYMSLSLNDADEVNSEDDIHTLELTALPPNYASAPESACIKDIFTAMNTCADLHPDPDVSGGEEDEDFLDDSAPGASGWITAENMDEYMDEEGNFTGLVVGEELGPGAGTVRQRDDQDGGAGTNGVDGHEEKYYKTG